jgi:DNA polymerase
MPDMLREAFADPGVIFHAFNAAFERVMLREVLGFDIPPERWRCTMVLCLTNSLPGHLATAGAALGLSDDKAKIADGRRLINKFCKPQRVTKKRPAGGRLTRDEAPEDWSLFVEYCRRDVVAEAEIDHLLEGHDLPAHEWASWARDQIINDRGLPVDVEFVHAAIKVDEANRAELLARASELTGLANPNSRAQLLGWLEGRGFPSETLRKNDVVDLLERDNLPADVREALTIRAELAKTSVTKYETMRDAAVGGRLRGCFQFAGAGRTWRWAGRLIQPQNLPRGNLAPEHVLTARDVVLSGDAGLVRSIYGSVADVLSSLVRPAIKPPPGKVIVADDFSSIETVVLAWAADCESLLDVFRSGRCAYREMATRVFGCHYGDVDKAQRQYAKPIVLGCGYYLGAPGLVDYATQYRVDMTLDQAKAAVFAYRDAYPEIVRYWHRLDAAFRWAVTRARNGQAATVGACRFRKVVDRAGSWVAIDLPSGRSLWYYDPRIIDGKFGPGVTYLGVDSLTKKWRRQETHPGKVTENIVQAVARDLLDHALANLEGTPGHEIFGHVHDEILDLVDEEFGEVALDQCTAAMADLPYWFDAPLGAKGSVLPFYMKD